jgi:hypothetical protein
MFRHLLLPSKARQSIDFFDQDFVPLPSPGYVAAAVFFAKIFDHGKLCKALFEVQGCFVRILFFSRAEGLKKELKVCRKETFYLLIVGLWYCDYFFLCSLKKKRTMGSTNLCLFVNQVQVPNH